MHTVIDDREPRMNDSDGFRIELCHNLGLSALFSRNLASMPMQYGEIGEYGSLTALT